MEVNQLIYLLPVVTELAQCAGQAIMEIYDDPETINVIEKSDKSPLTQADLRANEIICAGLRELRHDIPIISEENKQLPYEERKGYDWFWLVDPLDGTKEFIKRNGQFTVNIALCRGNQSLLGIIDAPSLGLTYYAATGHGAWRLTNNTDKTQIRVARAADSDVKKVVASASHMDNTSRAWIDNLGESELVQIGSSLKFMKVAEGSAHYYPRFHPCMEWDTAAAHAILTEAGGFIENHGPTGDTTLVYNKESLLTPNFVARSLLC